MAPRRLLILLLGLGLALPTGIAASWCPCRGVVAVGCCCCASGDGAEGPHAGAGGGSCGVEFKFAGDTRRETAPAAPRVADAGAPAPTGPTIVRVDSPHVATAEPSYVRDRGPPSCRSLPLLL